MSLLALDPRLVPRNVSKSFILPNAEIQVENVLILKFRHPDIFDRSVIHNEHYISLILINSASTRYHCNVHPEKNNLNILHISKQNYMRHNLIIKSFLQSNMEEFNEELLLLVFTRRRILIRQPSIWLIIYDRSRMVNPHGIDDNLA